MWFLLAVSVFLSPPGTNDSLLVEQTRRQVRQYVHNIQHDKNEAINLWALSVVIEARPQMRNYLKNHLARLRSSDPLFAVFRDSMLANDARLRQLAFGAQSPLLLVTYLLKESDNPKRRAAARRFAAEVGYASPDDVAYQAIVKTLLNGGAITDDMLPAAPFHPLHYFLFYASQLSLEKIFSDNYLQTISEYWSFSGTSSLKKSMGIATLFKVYYFYRNYSKIQSLYSTILHNYNLPNYSTRLSLLRALDYSMYRLGYYHRSIKIMRDYAIPLARYLKKFETVVKLKVSQGSNLYRIGKFEASKQVYLSLIRNEVIQKFSVSKARVLNNLAVNYLKSGELNKYENLLFKALKKGDQENIYSLQIKILQNLFGYYYESGDYNSAKAYLIKAKKLASTANDQATLGKFKFLEGLLYRDFKNNYERALASFNEALRYLSPQKNYAFFQVINTEIAFLFEERDRYQKALKRYNQIIDRAQKRDDMRNVLEATVHKANVFLKTGRRDSAKAMLHILASHHLDILNFDHLIKAKTVRARYLVETNRPKQAYELLKPALEQVVKRSRSSGSLKTGFWQVEPEYLYAFEVMANLLINTDRQEQAVEVLDRLKTINDAELYQNPLARSQVLNEKELSRYKRLTNKLSKLRKNLLTADGKQKANIQLQIDKLSAQKKALDLKITSRAALQPVTVDEVQRRLSAKERVLHITELNDIYYLAVISRTSVRFNKIPIDKSTRKLFEKSIALLASGKTDLNRLYKITRLLGIKKLPAHVRKLIILPDSYLYQLPLAVLPLEPPAHSYSYGSARYLIEQFKTVYKTSLNDFNYSLNKSEEAFDFAGFGVSRFNKQRALPLTPLPLADTEVKKVSAQLTELNEKKILLNNAATEAAFRRFAPRAGILHMATHSTVSARNPLFSSIFLSAPENEDNRQYEGRVFAYELFDLNLSSDLIMLNSCESASGSYLQGSGVVGISRALRYAGAEALLLNLWPVNDMLASQFAVKFYKKLNEGFSKAEALRNARLHFLSNNNANPYYWGSYMLLGNTEPVVQPYQFTNKVAAVSFMAFFVIFAVGSSLIEWRRRRKA